MIINGNSLDVLKQMPPECVDMCITSPPYWGLRNYGVDGQLGLEKTPAEYINALCNIFDEVKRVLKPAGSCWVNLGDCYIGGHKGGSIHPKGSRCDNADVVPQFNGSPKEKQIGMKEKCLVQIPSRFSIEMCNRGWILRNEIIWHKPSCMPSSVKDRFTIDFEKLFFFTKEPKYYFEKQYEPLVSGNYKKYPPIGGKKKAGGDNATYSGNTPPSSIQGRNKRCVWSIATKPFKGAHFATYPETLIETPIKACCPEFICKKCHKPRVMIYEQTGNMITQGGYGSKTATHVGVSPTSSLLTKKVAEVKAVGLSDCGCNAGWTSGVVLDPFSGAATTGLVAKKQGKKYIGIELNAEYCKMSEERLK